MSIQYTQGYPSARQIQSAAQNYGDYGAIMMFNVRDYDASGTMNNFASTSMGWQDSMLDRCFFIQRITNVMLVA